MRHCHTCKLILQSNTCLPKPNGFFFVQGNWQLSFLGHLESCLTGQNYSNSCINYPCEMFLIQLNPFRWLSGALVTFFQLPWGQAEWPYKYETTFLDVVWGQIYTWSELQIITQVLIGLRDDSKNDWAVSEDNCFCRVFYPSGRLHWEKRHYFVSYKNPTPIYSAKRLAWLILLWVMSDPLHKAAFWRNENSAMSLGERFPKCPNGPQGQFNRIQPSMNKYITY